jgi:hypothetical protein
MTGNGKFPFGPMIPAGSFCMTATGSSFVNHLIIYFPYFPLATTSVGARRAVREFTELMA